MSFSLRSSSWRSVAVGVAALLLGLAGIGAVGATMSRAAYYKMVACSADNGAPPYTIDTNTRTAETPDGIFDVWNRCGGSGGDPPGESALIRIQEDRDPPHTIRQGAYANVYFDAPSSIHFKAAGGFTREPFQFADGWRARFWIAGASPSQQIMSQGTSINPNELTPPSNSFGPHLWSTDYLDFNRFVFELTCVRAARCDVSGNNAADLNALLFILSDDSDPQVSFTKTEVPFMAGRWVKGAQYVTFAVSDAGSGMREERLYIDGSELWSMDHGAECSTSTTPSNGEWARSYSPCPTGGPWDRSIAVNTAAFKDGSNHTVQVCAQDFAQFQGLNGTGGQSCTSRTVATDNTPPTAPLGLSVVTPNPARYLDQFGAQFALPPNEGSPIVRAYYNIVDAAGNVVTPAQAVAGVNPSAIQTIQGPKQAGDYRLQVWLEDEVGFVGPPATVPIPHDTTPPAAPQGAIAVAPKNPRGADGFDLRWHNLVDSGSPIDAAHYRIVDGDGAAVVPEQTITGENVEAIRSLDTPRDSGGFTLELWLSDAEGNIGAPVTIPLVYDCVRDDVDSGASLSSSVGPEKASRQLVPQGDGSLLTGKLLDAAGGPVGEAPICIFSQITTDLTRKFLGVAMTSPDGSYEFAVTPGASRYLIADYRAEHREVSSKVELVTQVKPTFEVESSTVRNKEAARFRGTIPGPHNESVIVVLQARKGDGWIVFRRLSTGPHGNYAGRYRFNRTEQPTEYIMRAVVPQQPAFPYEGGTSSPLQLIVYPERQHDHTEHGDHRHGDKSSHKHRTEKTDCRGRRPKQKGCKGGRDRSGRHVKNASREVSRIR